MRDHNNRCAVFSAGEGDVGAWMAFLEEVAEFFPGLERTAYEQSLRRHIAAGTAICAKIEGTLAGGLLFSLDPGALAFIAVHPAFRGKGIASRLLAEMLGRFPPGRDIEVITYREGDPQGCAARTLYKKLGFGEGELIEEFGYPCQKFVLRTR